MIHADARRTSDGDDRGIGELIKDLSRESGELLRKEVELAKAEMGEKAAHLGRNLAYLAVGGLIAYAAFLTLIFAASVGLMYLLDGAVSKETATWLAPLIVGVVVGIVGAVLIVKSIATLKSEPLFPEKSLESLRESSQWLKQRMT